LTTQDVYGGQRVNQPLVILASKIINDLRKLMAEILFASSSRFRSDPLGNTPKYLCPLIIKRDLKLSLGIKLMLSLLFAKRVIVTALVLYQDLTLDHVL
jgi:hypothetical protein